MRIVTVILISVLIGISAYAENEETIVQKINREGKCVVIQPDKMEQRLHYVATADTVSDEDLANSQRLAGYRIQIFSDNNYRTAKSEARSKETAISERFPELRTYVIYNTPFWRLRVGDFRTQDEALEKVVEIKEAFPQFSREIRVVRDRINYIPQE